MAVTTANLLKMLVPIFSAIGGVFVTSSPVSKSAEEQEKEKPLTKLKDKDPIIEEYEDANEGEYKGGQQSPQGQKGNDGGDGGGPANPVDKELKTIKDITSPANERKSRLIKWCEQKYKEDSRKLEKSIFEEVQKFCTKKISEQITGKLQSLEMWWVVLLLEADLGLS